INIEQSHNLAVVNIYHYIHSPPETIEVSSQIRNYIINHNQLAVLQLYKYRFANDLLESAQQYLKNNPKHYPLLEVKEENAFSDLPENIHTSIKNLNNSELQVNNQFHEQESQACGQESQVNEQKFQVNKQEFQVNEQEFQIYEQDFTTVNL
ncbi:18240_t:CDS:2, partial [Racocetra fulgida]